MSKISFYQNRICLNVLAKDPENARDIYEATEGHVLIGVLSKQFATAEEALPVLDAYKQATNDAVSIGLGAGDPNQWRAVVEISELTAPAHVNQIFSKVGVTREAVGQNESWINGLVHPAGRVGYVKAAIGDGEPIEMGTAEAIDRIRAMGGNAVKYFPMNGLETKEQYLDVVRCCAETDFAIEPTGGLDLSNFREIVEIALQAGVKQVIPHVYSSIIDKETGKTNIEDVKQLYEVMKELGDSYGE
ncbi:oxo-acid lyase [Ornithinibacillus gellani]|uniref:2-dehydro-3-deoxy-phosphogluconate aldolase n=1 Tax=Ornithinibacillus gellani TaxID=2293253 RepID=UPI000F49D001|nr:KDGP aldolase [Ornithinibacillus gellani]TQS71077.1 oxo-acid lyase [Ornithinibacillus gellani]